MPVLLLAILLAMATPAAAPSVPEAAPSRGTAAPGRGAREMRGLWVVRTALVSPEAVDRVVDEAVRGGFNALFVQVRGRGDAFYRSRFVPRAEQLRGQPAAFDPLARLLERARPRGLQVHAWANALLTAGFDVPLAEGNVVRRHPEWLMVPRAEAGAALHARGTALRALVRRGADADVEGYYLSPSVPEVHAHLERVVRELLAAYPVDGLHLDFIRYPTKDHDWSRAALAAFRERSAWRGGLLDGPAHDPEGWADYRRQALDRLVARLARAARETRPGLVVSAAVVPEEAKAREQRLQDWTFWLAAGWIDAACPMAYTPDTETFRAQITTLRTRVGASPPLWAGVGAYRLPIDGVVEKIHAAREAGASGVVVFSHESVQGGDLDRLRTEGFAAEGPRR